jgi:hypothetical protein
MTTDIVADTVQFIAPVFAVLLTAAASVWLWRRQSAAEWTQRRRDQAEEWAQRRREQAAEWEQRRNEQNDAQSRREREREADERGRRNIIATALLVELRWTERALRNLVQQEHAGNAIGRLSLPVYDRFELELPLFSWTTVRRLVEFKTLVSTLNYTLDQRESKEVAQMLARFHHWVRVQAAFAARAIPQLRADLEAAEGFEPDEPPEIVVYPRIPDLPPRAWPQDDQVPFSTAVYVPGQGFAP